MILHVLALFLYASFGTEFCAGDVDTASRDMEDRYDDEVASFRSGLYVYGENGEPVEINQGRAASGNVGGKITFKLYTTESPTGGHELKTDDATTLENSGFDPSKPTYMITHGWRNNQDSPSCVLVRDAYLANTDSNVIVIDWSSYSMSIYYIDVTYKVKEVGQVVQQFIRWLYAKGLKADDVTLVGHSLGAHVMGLAGYKLTPQVNNIVGLDPALPMFNFAGHGDALTKKDARHVQIIHTNAGLLGYACSHGHSDFFPNGGIQQPGCCTESFGCFACDHARAVEYFAESISKTFNGIECDTYAYLQTGVCDDGAQVARMGGLDLESVPTGTYYLETNSIKPFSELNGVPTPPDNRLAAQYQSALFRVILKIPDEDFLSLTTLIGLYQNNLIDLYLLTLGSDVHVSSSDVDKLRNVDATSFLVSEVCVWRPVIRKAVTLFIGK